MAQMDVIINFETNARAVRQQIASLNSQVAGLQASTARLGSALDKGRATSRSLTGDIRARQSIIKLDKQIQTLAERRMKTVTRGMHFGEQDQFVKGLIKSNEVLRIQHKILQDNANAWVNMGKNTQWAGRQLVVGFTVPLTLAAGAAMKAFSDLEKELVKFKRVYGDVNTTSEQTDAMAESVKRLATEWTKYGVAVKDTIGLAAEAAGAGFQDQQLIAQVEAASKLATLGQLEQQKAMQATIALQSTFKQSNRELGTSINFLNQLENQTMVTMEDMVIAIPKAATIIQGLGGTVQDLGVMMAALREGGVSAAEGANALKSGLGSLLNPSKAAREALSTVGVDLSKMWAESEKNGEGVIFVVKQLATSLDSLGSTKRQQLMEELFGKHQFARMNALMANINKGNQALQAAQVAQASPLERALVAQQELNKLGSSSLTEFQSAVEKLKAAIAPLGKIIMDVVTPAIKWVGDLVEWFNSLPDIVKQISIGFVALGGVIAPLFLMLLGQIQNLVGNGLKFLNFMRGWGRNTQWISQENLTLANSLTRVDSQLIAENKTLQKNIALWEARQAAAMTPGMVGPTVAPTGRGRRGRRFARGGTVGGSGSGDTIPALLTPGEFVVNKKAAGRFSSVLSAINSGNLPGFAAGGSPRLTRLASAKQKKAEVNISDVSNDPAKLAKLKRDSENKLFAYKREEQAEITSIIQSLIRRVPALEDAIGSLRINVRQWDQSHINAADRQRLLIDAETATGGKTKPWNYRGDLIMDNHMINRNLPGNRNHPISVTAARRYKPRKESNPIEMIILSEFLKWRTSGSGSRFYSSLMDDNFIFMNLMGAGQKSIRAKQTGHRFNKVSMLATGGFVPGRGNKDTVPAMLTPGEAVINKKAASKFGGILSAINEGRIKLFQGGTRRKRTVPEQLRAQGIDQGEIDRLRDLVPNMNMAVYELTRGLSEEVDMRDNAITKLRATYEQEGKTRVDGSHIVRAEIDALTGEPKVQPGNIIFDQHAINQLYEDLSKLGPQFDAVEKEMKQNVIGMQKQQEAMDKSSQEFKDLQRDINLTERALEDLQKGRHVLDPTGRAAVAQAVIAAEKKQAGLFSKGTGLYAAGITARRESMFNIPFETAGGTKGEAARREAISRYERKNPERPRPGGGGRGGGGRGTQIDSDDGPGDRARGRGFDFSTIFFAFSMLTGQFTGLTDSLGKFGDAITIASTALMMFGNMIPTGGGLKGIVGKGAVPLGKTGIGAKFAKFGLGAGSVFGAAGALAGGFLGNQIKDNRGGARDVAGNAVAWGATGAGLGMMFGPWGAAIGGAVGALAGFTVQILANKKAQKEAADSAMKTSETWNKVTKELADKYDLGTGKSLEERFSELNIGNDEANKELYEMLKENELGQDGLFTKVIGELEKQRKGGFYGGPQQQLNSMILNLRGEGVSEKDITLIARALIAALPENLKGGLVAEAYTPPTTKAILDRLEELNRIFVENAGKQVTVINNQGAAPQLTTQYTGGTGQSVSPTTITSLPKLEPTAVIEAATLYKDAFQSLTEIMLNASAVVNAYKNDKEELTQAEKRARDEAQKTLTATEKQRESLMKLGKEAETNAMAAGRGEQFFATLAMSIDDLVRQGKGQGLKEGDFRKFLDENHGNAVQLTSAAKILLLAGQDLRDAAGNIMSAGAIQQMADLIETGTGLQDQLTSIRDQRSEFSSALGDIQTLRDEAALANQPGQKKLKAAEAAEEARQDKWAKINQGWAIKNAKLDITRIHIEERTLKAFVSKFNKAFGASIDSFADAQYEIDKIGLKIRAIQVKTIDPIQEKADDLRRINELANRKLEDLQKKEQDRIDATNQKYEDQADILEQIGKQHDYILTQQGATADLVAAFASGNTAEIAKAQAALNQNLADFTRPQASGRAEEAEDVSPYKAEIEKIEAEIEARNKTILGYEDQIYNINESQVEPLQRRSDLMSLMLDTTRSVMEFQKANAAGIDQENLARKEALSNAKEALDNAIHARDVSIAQKEADKETNRLLDERIIKLQRLTGLKTTDLKVLEDKVKQMDADAAKAEERAVAAIGKVQTAMANIRISGEATVDIWNNPIAPGSTIATIDSALEYIRTGKVPDPEKYTNPKQETYLERYRRERGSVPSGPQYTVTRASGGTIQGSGGMDSVPAMLTPGEFVMRKSAVDRIGVPMLTRMNMGVDPEGGKPKHKYNFAAGGEVPFYNGIVDPLAAKIVAEPKIQSAMRAMALATPTAAPAGGIPHPVGTPDLGGPIPGLGSSVPPPSGMAASRAYWIKPSAVRMMNYVKRAFPWAKGTTYMSNGEHGSGKAVDYWPSLPYRGSGNLQGWKLARWAKKWAGPLKVKHIIWDDKIWSVSRKGEGWRKYSHYSGSMSDTDRHLNHLHILNYKKGGLVKGYADGGLVSGSSGIDNIPAMLTPGEFVMSKNAVDRVGTLPLKRLNTPGSNVRVPEASFEQVEGDVVYNDYQLTFNIAEGSDSYEIATIVLRELQRTNNSKVRTRR